nr:polysaccharide deacetylase family protein [uncultured Cellulosilyticum sp.]
MKKRKSQIRIWAILLCAICIVQTAWAQDVKNTQESQQKVLYLTFDDGPSEYTQRLLDLLDAHHMKATFFMLKDGMESHPDVVKRMVEEGHGIGLHGVSHEKDMFYSGTRGPLNEMECANSTLEKIAGFRTPLVRTPYGSYPYLSKAQLKALTSHEYIIWDWNVDSRDWSYRNPQRTYAATTKMMITCKKQPKVVLFHDIHHVLETMELFINWMEENGYTSEAITPEVSPVRLGQTKKGC